MKIENFLKVENKKTLFFNEYLLPLYNTTLAFTNDTNTVRKIFIEKYGRTKFDILTSLKKKDRLTAPNYYVEPNNVNLSDYDELILGTTINQAFGGIYRKYTFEIFKQLSNYKGEVYYYFNDIDSYPFDLGKACRNRLAAPGGFRQLPDKTTKLYFTEEELNNLSRITTTAKLLSSWHNYDIIINANKRHKLFVNVDWMFFDLNQVNIASTLYKDVISNYIPLNERKYDFLFYSVGFKFKQRLKVINNYIKDEDKKLFIGLTENEDNIPNVDNYSNIKIENIISDYMPQCRYTLIFSCPNANNNIITWRYYECMYGNVMAFILEDFDPEHKYVKNEELKKFIYVKSPEEYFEKIKLLNENENLYKHYIDLEREEIISL